MKKFLKGISVFAAFSMILASGGCDGTPEETTATEDPALTAVTDENGTPVTDEEGNMIAVEPEEEIVYKVGFIYNGLVEDGSTSAIFENSRDQLEKVLGVETCYLENILVSQIPTAVRTLQDDGCNIIVSASSCFANSIEKEANGSSDTYYISFGGENSGSNISCFGGELYQTANVCGIAAAYNTETNILGIVADPSAYNVFGIVNAYTLGAKEIWGTQTDVRLNWVWSDNEAKIEEAIDNLVSQGSDIIMCYTENDYAAEYCEQIGVKVIANSCNLPEIAPNQYLTGFFFNSSTFIVDTVRSIIAENFVSTVHSGGIAAGTARLVDFSENCKTGTDTISSKLYDYIKTGKAHAFTGEIKNRDYTVMVEKGQQMNFNSIRKIDWLVLGITTASDFTTVIQEPVPGDLVIKN